MLVGFPPRSISEERAEMMAESLGAVANRLGLSFVLHVLLCLVLAWLNRVSTGQNMLLLFRSLWLVNWINVGTIS